MSDPIIWRIVSWKKMSGGMNWYARDYMFDDLVAADRLPEYFKLLETRGIEDAKFERKGPLSWVMENLNFKPRKGTKQLSLEKLNHKLEDFIDA